LPVGAEAKIRPRLVLTAKHRRLAAPVASVKYAAVVAIPTVDPDEDSSGPAPGGRAGDGKGGVGVAKITSEAVSAGW
jgi:hypothetical protein